MTEDDDDLLNDYLRSLGVRNLFCMGLAGDYCVSATAHSALRLGYRVYWIRSGIRSVSGSSGQLSIERSLCSSSSSSSSSPSSSSFELIDNQMETIKKLSL
ncbi:hypothetical protein PGTUg99_006125 [Puccinia graminis f. sp. tritici]|uniref:Isochorismatase-like domain-containing protein n=1 Tax=Puccinia graminis f. sp. tritici TaxID=56615 RepID=A0A5B0MPF9_PUCGR|nr:hypothetical protein PGTUg99_006125 [Puccinia graminis f. sp. tritici]